MSETRTVRTTMQPWLPLEVDDAEYADLERQGLLLADENNQLLVAERAAAAAGAASTTRRRRA